MVFFIFIVQANSGDPDKMPHSVASDLDLHYLPMSNKKDARYMLYCLISFRLLLKCNYFAYLIKSCRNLGSILLV